MTTEVTAWKRLVAEAVTTDPSAPLQLESFGAANQIIGYRIYYMLQFAKRAGLTHVSLLTDGGFWIDEATDWLIESGVDEIVLVAANGQLAGPLADRVRSLAARGPHVPSVTVQALVIAAPLAL